MRTFQRFLEDIKDTKPVPLIGSEDAGTVGSSMLAKKMTLRQDNPVLYSAISKIRSVFMNSKKSILKTNKIVIGDNPIYGGSITLERNWGLNREEISALKKAGLLIDNGVGDMILKIEPFNGA